MSNIFKANEEYLETREAGSQSIEDTLGTHIASRSLGANLIVHHSDGIVLGAEDH